MEKSTLSSKPSEFTRFRNGASEPKQIETICLLLVVACLIRMSLLELVHSIDRIEIVHIVANPEHLLLYDHLFGS